MGVLQFDVAAYRLKNEYGVEVVVEPVTIQTARWIDCGDEALLARFRDKAYENLAEDGDGQLVYLAPTRVNLNLTEERWPDIRFPATRELWIPSLLPGTLFQIILHVRTTNAHESTRIKKRGSTENTKDTEKT